MIIVPEIILYETLQSGLKFVKQDYAQQSDKSQSWLEQVLTGIIIDNYDFKEQARKVILQNKAESPRALTIDFMFNMQSDGSPVIHITLPAEQTQLGGNGMGLDEGYADDIRVEPANLQPGSVTPVYTRRYQATYNIVITSNNTNEVILIYHFMKALILALQPHLSLSGLQNIAVGGQDVNMMSDKVPKNLFFRAIAVTLQYESSAPAINKQMLLSGALFKGTAVNELIN